MGLIELLGRAAQEIDREALSMRECHTVDGKWPKNGANVKAEYRALRDLAAKLRRAKKYHEPNPLGGPAKVFDAIADSVRAGDALDATMARFGVQWAPAAPSAATDSHQTEKP